MTPEEPMEESFFRVQDSAGRGPFRPGLPDRWCDPDGPDFPAVQEDFGLAWLAEIPAGWHCGCALRGVEQVRRWFSPHECARLNALGFHLVSLRGRAIRESEHQVVLVRPQPLRWQAIVQPWPHLAAAALDPWKVASPLRAPSPANPERRMG